MYMHPGDGSLRQILQPGRTIAVVGLSDKIHRDSYQVALYMQEQGYRIIPVNPRAKEVLGEASYPDLLSIPVRVDIVNVFRRSEQVPPVMEEALRTAPGAIWLQLGIVNDKAAETACRAGIAFVMDKCIKVEHARLFPRR